MGGYVREEMGGYVREMGAKLGRWVTILGEIGGKVREMGG
jgi:hypothetical protein